MKGRRWGISRQRVRSLSLTTATQRNWTAYVPDRDQIELRHRLADLQVTVSPTAGSTILERAIAGSAQHIGLAQIARAKAVFHDNDARKNIPGFPDIWMIVGHTLYVLECKSKYGNPTPEQAQWLDAIAGVTEIVHGVLRPADYEALAKEIIALSLLDQELEDTTTP
jgi:hypothetical protein